MKCFEAVHKIWSILDGLTPIQRTRVLHGVGLRINSQTGEIMELSLTEEHLIVCEDCDELTECQADLKHCCKVGDTK